MARLGGNLVHEAANATTVIDNFTLALWLNYTSFAAGNDHFILLNGSGGTGYGLYYTTGSALVAFYGGVNGAAGGGAFSTTGWNHWTLRRLSGTGQIFRNGATFGSTFADTPLTPVATGGTSGIISLDPAHTVELAEMAIWDRALSDGEIAALGKGYTPAHFLSSIKFYAPILGYSSPEIDVKNRFDLTLSGTTTKAPHPPIIKPRRSRGK